MSSRTIITCDIKGCEEDAVHKQQTVSVRFLTETTEGRSVTPYLDSEKLDLCKGHYQYYVDHLPLTGSGAQGYNDYEFE